MNASAVFVLFMMAFLAVASCFPTAEYLEEERLTPLTEGEPQGLEPHFEVIEEGETGQGRFRRATCDLLSISLPIGSLNHSACAAHCLALRKGFRGGRCKDGVCHCRK